MCMHLHAAIGTNIVPNLSHNGKDSYRHAFNFKKAAAALSDVKLLCSLFSFACHVAACDLTFMLPSRWHFKLRSYPMKNGLEEEQNLCRMARIKEQGKDESCKCEGGD